MKKQTYTLTLFIALALGALVAIGYGFFSSQLSQSADRQLVQQQKQLATIAASEIERYFYDVQKRMETIAQMPVVRKAERSENCNKALQKIVEVNKQEMNNLGRVDKNGQFVCAVNRTIIGEPVSKYGDYFAKIAKDPQHRPAMSRLILPSGSANPVVAVHVPVFTEDGTFDGTIGGAVYFETLKKQVLGGTKLTPNTLSVLYDNNLDVLYNPDPLLQNSKLSDPEVTKLYSPQSAITTLIDKVKTAPNEGILDYKLRDVARRAYYKSAKVIDRHWTFLVIVPESDRQARVVQPLAQSMYLILGSSVVLLGTTLSYSLLSRGSRRK